MLETAKGMASAVQDGPFEAHAVRVMYDLREAFLRIIEALPGGGTRATDLEKTLGVSRTLGWQLHRLATTSDPLAAGLRVPGSTAVGQALRAARSVGVPDERVARAAAAMEAFESLVKRHAGDRSAFETMIGSLAGSAAETIDVKTRREAFRVHGRIWGVQVKTLLACCVLHPGKDPDSNDRVMIRGMREARWLRPGVPLYIVGQRSLDGARRPVVSTAVPDGRGEPLGAGPTPLREFSSPELPELESRVEHGNQYTYFRESSLGNAGVKTVYLADIARGVRWKPTDGERPYHIRAAAIMKPTAMLVLDTLIHRDMFGVLEPAARVSGSLARLGEIDPHEFREDELMPVEPELRYCGTGPGVLATPHVPQYREMVESVLGRVGWDPEAFDLYRCTLSYPPLSTMVQVRFDLPESGE